MNERGWRPPCIADRGVIDNPVNWRGKPKYG